MSVSMTNDFYKKVQELSEKFQKRELDCLNAERKWSSVLNKKDCDSSLQEFFLRIDRRERETEETYRSIIKQMEDLDKHIDLMSLKLEKLQILKNNLKTFELVNESLIPVSNGISEDISENVFVSSLMHQKKNMYTISTQTESQFQCLNCNTEQTANKLPCLSTENSFSTKYLQSGLLDHSSEHLTSAPSRPVQTICESSEISDQLLSTEIHPFKSTLSETLAKSVNQKPSDLLEEKLLEKKDSLVEDVSLPIKVSSDKTMVSADSLKSLTYENSNKTVKSIDGNVELLKNDQKHKNNEFGILESETPYFESIQSQATSNRLQTPEKTAGIKDANEKCVNRNDKDKSDSSCSANEPSSAPEIVLPGYNSDSFSEKETTPLKASAAYQALLGKTVPLKNNQKTSDSDTEDEVERALASAVSKNNKPLSTKAQTKKEENLTTHVDVKSPLKTSKTRKSSKLSDTTRRVLGLDASSGSETELAVDTTKRKIEEDSDEFDFFD